MSNEIAKVDQQKIDFQEFVKTLSDEQPPRKNCILCASPHRTEAQEMALRGQTNMAIFRWLVEKGVDIKYGAVNNHINEHFKPFQTNVQIKSLAERMDKWSKLDRSDEALLNRYIETLDNQYMDFLSQHMSLPAPEQRKNTELMLKIAAQIAAFKDQLHKLESADRPVDIFFSTLKSVVQIKLQNLKDPEQRQLLFEVLTEVERAAGDTFTDGAKLVEKDK
jgi:hypothetical protein